MKIQIRIGLTLLCVMAFQWMSFAGIPDGKYRELYANGKIRVTGYYHQGEKHKTWMYYDETGKRTRKEKWRKGNLQWTAEYENGRLRRTIDSKGRIIERPACGCN